MIAERLHRYHRSHIKIATWVAVAFNTIEHPQGFSQILGSELPKFPQNPIGWGALRWE
jgi:hypothetical protein